MPDGPCPELSSAASSELRLSRDRRRSLTKHESSAAWRWYPRRVPESSAGWHPDPFERHEFRYWDGSTWTDHVVTRGQQETDPLDAPPPTQAASSPEISSSWQPDPTGRHELRFWDGSTWTDHVATGGRQSVDPLTDAPAAATTNASAMLRAGAAAMIRPNASALLRATMPPGLSLSRGAQKIQKQVQRVGLADTSGTANSGILSEPVLVINQKGKLLELRAQYAIHDREGRQLAAVRGKRMSSRMQVVDMNGSQLLELRREASMVSSKVTVAGPNGARIGRIVPSSSWKHVDRAFKLESADNQLIGAVFSEDRQRRRDFNVQDSAGAVVARISKTRAGLAKELFTKGDNYVLEVPGSLPDPLRSLGIAAVLVIDTAYHQQ